MAEAAI
jgi:hypothetical protein